MPLLLLLVLPESRAMRATCVVILAITLLNACASAPIDRQPHPDFSGGYLLNRDRSIESNSIGFISGQFVKGACGDQYSMTQDATTLTIHTLAGTSHEIPIDGVYKLDGSESRTTYPGVYGSRTGEYVTVSKVSRSGKALQIILTQYFNQTRTVRDEYMFQFNKDGTLSVEFRGEGYLKSVYQK